MKPLGYVLIVLNLIAGGAFLYLATQSWSERQKWTYADFRHQVALRGLPVDTQAGSPYANDPEKVPFDFQYEGAGRSRWITKKALQDIFGATGNPVFSQRAELERLRDDLFGTIRDAESPAAKLTVMTPVLLRMAVNNAERDEALALRADPTPENVEAAQGRLRDYFDSALNEGSETNKRRKIARILVNAGSAIRQPEAQVEWQQRVITVVGLEEYVDAVAHQASLVRNMITPLSVQIANEKSEFLTEYGLLVQTSRDMAARYDRVQQQVVRALAERDEARALLDRRSVERDDLIRAYEFIKAETEQELIDQASLESQLYQTEVQLGAALDAIVRLESELRELELGTE